jgi:hypothetical protein
MAFVVGVDAAQVRVVDGTDEVDAVPQRREVLGEPVAVRRVYAVAEVAAVGGRVAEGQDQDGGRCGPAEDGRRQQDGEGEAIGATPVSQSIADITAIIGKLRARNPSMTILVAQIIPTSVGSTNTRIEALNAEIAGLAYLSTAQSPVIIVDQYSGYDGQRDNQAGGTHPLTSGELKMAARWRASLIPLLDGSAPPGPPEYGPYAVPGRIEAENYAAGGYVDTTAGNTGSAYRYDDVDIEYAASEGSYAVGWVRDGESLTYTANVAGGGPFRLSARVASPYDGRRITLEVNGTVAAELRSRTPARSTPTRP